MWPLYRSLQVDRKQVPADWSRKLQAIQAKAAEVGGGTAHRLVLHRGVAPSCSGCAAVTCWAASTRVPVQRAAPSMVLLSTAHSH